MPIITVQMLNGRTPDQKRLLIREPGAAATRVLGVPEEAVRIVLAEVAPEHWGSVAAVLRNCAPVCKVVAIRVRSRTESTGGGGEITQRGNAMSIARANFPHVPAAFFGIVLGVAALANAWRVAQVPWGMPSIVGEALFLVAAIVWVIIALLYAAKWWIAAEPIASIYKMPVRWVLPNWRPVPFGTYATTLRMSRASDGSRLSCSFRGEGILKGKTDADGCGDTSAEPKFPSAWFGPYAGRPFILTNRVSMTVDGEASLPAPPAPRDRDIVVFGRVHFTVAPDGSIVTCAVPESADATGIANICDMLKRFEPLPAGNTNMRAATFEMTISADPFGAAQ